VSERSGPNALGPNAPGGLNPMRVWRAVRNRETSPSSSAMRSCWYPMVTSGRPAQPGAALEGAAVLTAQNAAESGRLTAVAVPRAPERYIVLTMRSASSSRVGPGGTAGRNPLWSCSRARPSMLDSTDGPASMLR
jgi:hypothetical protein